MGLRMDGRIPYLGGTKIHGGTLRFASWTEISAKNRKLTVLPLSLGRACERRFCTKEFAPRSVVSTLRGHTPPHGTKNAMNIVPK
jgi:hypothetical protein